MRFLIDAQLSPVLVAWLRAKGHEAEHVVTVLGESSSDRAIVENAASTGAVVVSKDGDFVGLLEGRDNAPALLRVRVGNAVNRVLLERLELAWSRIEGALLAGASVVELD